MMVPSIIVEGLYIGSTEWIWMPQHGEYDQDSKKWYCEYWMSLQEWNQVHYYSPSNTVVEEKEDYNDNNWEIQNGAKNIP